MRFVQAVCCVDHEHCCPQGYSCNLEFGTCVKASADLSVSLTAVQKPEIQCDASTRCAHTQSCCRLADSTWACCPYTQVQCFFLAIINKVQLLINKYVDIWLIMKSCDYLIYDMKKLT